MLKVLVVIVSHLHQSLPHWHCLENHLQGCGLCTSPSHRCSWPSPVSAGAGAGASQGPSTHRLGPSKDHFQNVDSASGTSDNFQLSITELKVEREGISQSPKMYF